MAPGPTAHVLLVDDDNVTRQLVQEILVDAGYEVVATSNGPAALDAARRQRPDVIVLDLVIPGQTAAAFAAQYREEIAAETPILVLSAAADLEVQARAVRATASLAKPFSIDDLLDRIAVLLGE